MVKNADKLYYPIKAAISSILPIVDEFVIALGDNDPEDRTREEILSIGSDKVKIIDTIWDLQKYSNGTENAHQTDIAKAACSGDWVFYLQADEVIHEQYLPIIKARCEELLDDEEVEEKECLDDQGASDHYADFDDHFNDFDDHDYEVEEEEETPVVEHKPEDAFVSLCKLENVFDDDEDLPLRKPRKRRVGFLFCAHI